MAIETYQINDSANRKPEASRDIDSAGIIAEAWGSRSHMSSSERQAAAEPAVLDFSTGDPLAATSDMTAAAAPTFHPIEGTQLPADAKVSTDEHGNQEIKYQNGVVDTIKPNGEMVRQHPEGGPTEIWRANGDYVRRDGEQVFEQKANGETKLNGEVIVEAAEEPEDKGGGADWLRDLDEFIFGD